MIGSEPVAPRAVADVAGPTEGPSARVVNTLRERPLTSICIASLLLAIISVLVLPWVPSSDPYAWISWGQEFASHFIGTKIQLSISGGPSWKPFPVVFTSVFGFFGKSGPGLWLVVSRTGSLLALAGVFRLARRYGGTIAGVLAVVALCMTQDAVFYFARGTSEPIVAASTVWAIELHLLGRRRIAYAVLFLGALNRPEFFPILILYAIYLWFTDPGARILAVALLVAVPVLWTFPPGITNGDFLQAKNAASGGKGSPGSAWGELKSAVTLMTAPVLILAGIGLAMAYIRRNWTLIWLGVIAILWALMVSLITQFFYGLPRYLLPAYVIGSVMAALAVVWIAEEAVKRLPRVRAGTRAATALTLAAGAVVLAATLPGSINRGKLMVKQVKQANQAGSFQKHLFAAVDQLGGKKHLLVCNLSYVAVNHSMASALAWKLKVDLVKTRPVMVSQGYVFSAPRTTDTGSTPPILSRNVDRVTLVRTVGEWKVYAVSRATSSAFGPAGSLCPGRI